MGIFLLAAGPGVADLAHAQSVSLSAAVPSAEEQWEADYRVIAARCGSPAFEKSFSAQSRQAVAAGLVSRRADAATLEKSIAGLRRSSLVLVPTSSDCPAKLAELKALQQSRHTAIAAAKRGGASSATRSK